MKICSNDLLKYSTPSLRERGKRKTKTIQLTRFKDIIPDHLNIYVNLTADIHEQAKTTGILPILREGDIRMLYGYISSKPNNSLNSSKAFIIAKTSKVRWYATGRFLDGDTEIVCYETIPKEALIEITS